MTATNEPRVSVEDRHALVAHLRNTKCVYDERGDHDTPTSSEARLIAAAVVSHGWEPRPRVSRARIDEYMRVAVLAGASASAAVRELMRELGIEVTDD